MTIPAPQLAKRAVSAPLTLRDLTHGDPPPTLSVREASPLGGFSPSHGYELIARGEFPFKTLRVGGRVRVLTASVIRVLTAED